MDNTALSLPDIGTFRHDMEIINTFQRTVHECMVEGQDFGVIPGTEKPTLLKPGAEKITKILGLADTYEIQTGTIEDWSKPFFHYVIKCTLTAVNYGIVISEGLGSCNSMESKYRWREAKRKCPNCGKDTIIKGKAEYGGGWLCFQKRGGCGYKWPDGAWEIEDQVTGQVENEDVYSIVNTLMKMAEKRALVDAALHAGRLSQVFTQDIEDMPGIIEGESKTVSDAPQSKSDVSKPRTTKTSDNKEKSAPVQEQAEKEQPEENPTTENGTTLNIDDISMILKELRDKGIKQASEENLLAFMRKQYKTESPTVLEAVALLKGGAAFHFDKYIRDMQDMA